MATICSVEQNHLGNFDRGTYEEYLSGIILNLDQWFRNMSFEDSSYLQLWRSSGSVERNYLNRGSYMSAHVLMILLNK